MPNLFDALQSLRNQPGTTSAQPQQDELQRIARARSGKAQVAAGPQASNLGEQRAIAAGNTAQQGVALAGNQAAAQIEAGAAQEAAQQNLQRQGLAQQKSQTLADLGQRGTLAAEQMQGEREGAEQKLATRERMTTDQMRANASQTLMKLAAESDATVDNLFRNFKRQSKDLELRQDGAELEQLGFLYALQDKKYLEELDRVGRARQLSNEAAFRREAAEIAFGSELSSAADRILFERWRTQTESELQKELAQIDWKAAMEVMRAETKSEAVKQVGSGVGEAVKYSTREDGNNG